MGVIGGIGTLATALLVIVPPAESAPSGTGSGYFVGVTGATVSSISADYVVPRFSCVGQLQFGMAVKIGAGGELSTGGATLVTCTKSGGTPVLSTVLSFVGNQIENPVKVKTGDKIAIRDTYGASQSTVTFTNLTTDQSVSETGPGGTGDCAFVGVVREAFALVPTFKVIDFTDARENGAPLSRADLTKYDLNLEGTQQVQTTVISHGTAFRELFKHN